MVSEELPNERNSLPGPLRGERALAQLATLTTPRRAGAYRRVLVVNGLTGCDAYTGVVLRACIDVHLASDPGNRVQIWEPKSPDVWSRLHDLLSPLPAECDLVGDQPYPSRNPEVIVPAIRIDQPQVAALLGHTIARAHSGLGVDLAAARAAAEAMVAFVDNAHAHASVSRIGVSVSCTLEPRTNELQLVALDLADGISAHADPAARLRDALARSRRDLGGLASLILLAERRGLSATLRLASGPARARWATDDRVRYDTGIAVPGFAAGFSIRL